MKNKRQTFPGILHMVIAVMLFAHIIPAHAQQSFFKQYNCTLPSIDGQYCNTGVTPDGSSYYYTCLNYLLETDLGGNVRWGREFRFNTIAAQLYALEERPNGGYFGGANANDQLQMMQHPIVFRLDTAGNTVWAKELQLNTSSGLVMRVAVATDGGLGICASFAVINGLSGAWVGKTDSLGNLLWGKIIRHGQLTTTRGNSIAPTRDGGFIVTSKISIPSSPTPHTGLSRLDANGNLLWTKTFASAGANDWPYATQCADGGFAITGCGRSTSTDGFRLCRTDSLGNLLWTTNYFTQGNICYGQKVQETTDRGFIITGNFLDMNTLDVYPLMIRTDSVGDTRWARLLTYTSYCGASSYDVQEAPDGGFLMPAADLSFIKTDPSGNIACVSFPVVISEVDTLVSQTSSLDFINGSSIIPAQFISNLPQFTDTTICAGKFMPTGIAVHDAIDAFTVYPNPSEGLFTLQFENGNTSYDVAVYNATGQLVRRYNNITSQLMIDLTSADAGFYFVRVFAEAGKRSGSVKLLKS